MGEMGKRDGEGGGIEEISLHATPLLFCCSSLPSLLIPCHFYRLYTLTLAPPHPLFRVAYPVVTLTAPLAMAESTPAAPPPIPVAPASPQQDPWPPE